MFVKLLRYEFKALMRVIPALYLVLLAAALATGIYSRIVDNGSFNPEPGIVQVFWGAALLILFIMNVVTVITRFRDNLLKDDGYLMFTLPVPEWALAASKAAAAFCAFLSSAVVYSVSLTIFAFVAGNGQVLDFLLMLPRFLSGIWSYPVSPPPAAVKIAVLVVVVVQQVCLWYAAAIAGHIAPRFHSLAGFGTYFVVMVFKQYLILAAASPPGGQQIPVIICIETAFAVVCFAAVNWLLKHRLNLE
ncbi:MAG: hypothetical protein LBP20_06605 [Treponema sp.]|jgi:hypothetical protein|nr:hypothetical protein [Treponema sp.]